MTTLAAFRATLSDPAPDPRSGLALQALWWAGKGGWDEAHGLVQQCEGTPDCDWIHAHLHRLEGDDGNAAYWYRRAGKPFPAQPPDAEWDAIAAALLARRAT